MQDLRSITIVIMAIVGSKYELYALMLERLEEMVIKEFSKNLRWERNLEMMKLLDSNHIYVSLYIS